ncbi:NnrU family protein [Falsiroseomonas selenitidurans]|uniref:NnrU family protein n=1 Tax=Falsiroseomonas selenitidurans TaxID=2716335 RepID=A0ABX1EBJ4_9PROT|nr:NnrU family protein [Falsiroseomonas selenitidurans]NKC34592.1 NnrU family protein [Falsiroseomonas selenitidurans]
MMPLILAALFWIGVHVGISGTALRDRVVAAVGEKAFMIGFSLTSVLAITLLVMAWQAAPTTSLWVAGPGLRWVLAGLMLPTLVLFMASHKRNPTAVGGKGLGEEARGIQRITRHPMLWSFALWAGIHILGNGDTASLVFFGAFLVTALAGMPSIDAKLARRHKQSWPGFAAQTSILPFGAIAAGRNRLALPEIGLMPPLVGLLLWAVLLHFHRAIFGVPALLM